jgi:hypothetical protein
MVKKIVTVLIVLSFLPVFLYSQERAILKQNGEIYRLKGELKDADLGTISKLYKPVVNKNRRLNPPVTPVSPMNLIDTLFVPGPYRSTPFGFYGQDWMCMWYKAPADLYLQQVGFWCMIDTADGGNGTTLEVKVVNVNWTEDQLLSYSTDAGPLGYYDAVNNYNNISAFEDNPDVTSGWHALPPFQDTIPPFGHDIWSDGGVGAPIIPTNYPDPNNPGYDWVDMNLLGVPSISAGTIFGIAIKDSWPVMDNGTSNSPYVGFGLHDSNQGTIDQTLLKFHVNGRNIIGQDYGWWVRPLYPLCFSAIVEIYGNTPPDINSFTQIHSDVNTGPFTIDANITDENPGTPDSAGVASAIIQWSIDGGTTWNDVDMTDMGSDTWSGEIPAQPGNTMVTYRIMATDLTGLTSTTSPVNFYVFEPSGANTLVIFNGFDDLTAFPVDSYWPSNVHFAHDTWNYGLATTPLLDNYDNVIEIWNENFGDYNDSAIRIWIEGASNRNYLLAGQEYLGAWNTYDDTSFVAGDFIYDILGIDSSFNDISYWGPSTNSIGDSLPTLQLPQQGTLFGQPLYDLQASVGADSLMFNPIGVYQTADNLNWQDGFHALPDVVVDMTVETRGIGAQWKPRPTPTVRILPTMAHRELTAGNKIVFLAYDPISLTTANDDTYPYWYWVGPDSMNSVFQALRWFDIILDANETGNGSPIKFALEQNYPNPFNPATTIKFSVPEASKVSLKIYDILGREVRTLVNETRNTGSYEVSFDASGLASGMYIYKITAGNYTASKKMMLLK